MVKNNIGVDAKVKYIENNVAQAKLAKNIRITGFYLSRTIKEADSVINKFFCPNDGEDGVQY